MAKLKLVEVNVMFLFCPRNCTRTEIFTAFLSRKVTVLDSTRFPPDSDDYVNFPCPLLNVRPHLIPADRSLSGDHGFAKWEPIIERIATWNYATISPLTLTPFIN